MIASSTYFFDRHECSRVSIVTYTTTDSSLNYFTDCEPEPPDPKKRMPFYRGVVKLNSVAVAELKFARMKKRQWNPSMGRVRIDRTERR